MLPHKPSPAGEGGAGCVSLDGLAHPHLNLTVIAAQWPIIAAHWLRNWELSTSDDEPAGAPL